MDLFLIYLLAAPVILAMAVALTSRENTNQAKTFALIGTWIIFFVSLGLFVGYQPQQGGFQFVFDRAWIPSIGARFNIGIDGISLFLVLLTTLLVPISLMA